MGPDKRSLLAITISILVFILWYSVIQPKFFPKEEKAPAATAQQATTNKTVKQEAAPPPAPEAVPEKKIAPSEDVAENLAVLENEFFKATFTNYGARPKELKLKKYTIIKGKEKDPVSLVPEKTLPIMPLQLIFEKTSFAIPEMPRYQLLEKSERSLRYRWSGAGVVIEKMYTLGDKDYDMDLKVTIKNTSGKSIAEQFSLGWSAPVPKKKSGGFLSFLKRPSDIKVPIYYLDGSVERENKAASMKSAEYQSGRLYWAGIEDRYFLAAILPRKDVGDLGVEVGSIGNAADAGFYTAVSMPEAAIGPNGIENYDYTIYVGPKEMNELKEIGMNLEKAINYGWFTVIAIPILYVLKFLHSIVYNWGVAIILLTILIKILLHPISKKSMKSMREMQKLQPRMKELKAKYAGDKQRLNAEMMQLFKTHKVNPMSGCLPMVLQFPVYIALYRVLWNSIELYQAPFFWIYKDLSAPDPYYITPVLLGVAMFLQQKLTPSASADPAQQKMMMMMPLMFAVFLAFLPVGLVIYILVNTLITVVQQWLMRHDMSFRDLLRGKFPKKAKT